MKLIFFFFLFVTSIIADSLNYSSTMLSNDKKIYTIQLVSTLSEKSAKERIQKIPKKFQKNTYIFKDKKYVALRYAVVSKPSQLKSALKEFKHSGFLDAYIMTLNSMPQIQTTLQKPKKLLSKPKISKFLQSKMILKAQKAYKDGDEMSALMYYEMIYTSGTASQKILNNLCYLYGKRGAWFDAKKIIDKQKYTSKLLYAYAYGAVQTNQQNFMSNISPYIILDRRGRIALLAGSYFENQHDLDKALGYYKMAYEKNPSDIYNIFAYARALDLNKNYAQAIKYYKKALPNAKNKKMFNDISRRVSQLEG